jgi:hypothetical protein
MVKPIWPLPVFSPTEYQAAGKLLSAKVVFMEGRKFEEADWQEVYCSARNIPLEGWSNLNIDVTFGNVGIEHKMLRKESGKSILSWCGTTQMHPSATRSIRPKTDVSAEIAMRQVFDQYREVLDNRARKVKESSGSEPDMRTGWLLWQESLREFLYFEEQTVPPAAENYSAQWVENHAKGARRGSKNLWIYDKETGVKRYSVTTEAGAKIQPYFDVPPLGAKDLYIFRAQGEVLDGGHVRVWVSSGTARELDELIGDLSPASLKKAIQTTRPMTDQNAGNDPISMVQELILLAESYETLKEKFDALSDEQSMRLLAACLRKGR